MLGGKNQNLGIIGGGCSPRLFLGGKTWIHILLPQWENVDPHFASVEKVDPHFASSMRNLDPHFASVEKVDPHFALLKKWISTFWVVIQIPD